MENSSEIIRIYVRKNLTPSYNFKSKKKYILTELELIKLIEEAPNFKSPIFKGFTYKIALTVIDLRYNKDFQLLKMLEEIILLFPQFNVNILNEKVANDLLEMSEKITIERGDFTKEFFNRYNNI